MQETVYSVSEAVKILEIKSHVLRYWEDEMKIPVQRNEMGHRYYTRYDIQVFLSINELKKKGYSLKEIGKLIPLFYYNSTKDIQNNQEPKVHKVLKGKNKKRARPDIRGLMKESEIISNPGARLQHRKKEVRQRKTTEGEKVFIIET